ncbi:hypothetical protein [Pseudonocardia humida]|uniref:Uncharacterized protein n=1 Tax=Pseudonocardia humida TaxID=2800819 RepID=A0ABT1A5Y2_9PSEU|nr:hypothetical protein [Pseudonocardia humida]MCO1658391.1 hypothetical protein [Pseudonocardia humida]
MSFRTRGVRLSAPLACALVLTGALAGCGVGGSVAASDTRGADTSTDRRAPVEDPFCAASRVNSEAISPLNRLVSGGGADREELVRAVDAVRRSGSDMVIAAPPEIRDDVQQTVDAVDLQLDALLANNGDGRAVSADPTLSARLDSAELAAAGEKVSDYLTRACGGTRR